MIILVLAARRPHSQHLGRDDTKRQHKTGLELWKKGKAKGRPHHRGNRCKEITTSGDQLGSQKPHSLDETLS